MTPSTLVFAIVLTVAVFFTVRLWIRSYYGVKIQGSDEQLQTDARDMQQLVLKAEKMEQRINALEGILDKDIPDWRNRK